MAMTSQVGVAFDVAIRVKTWRRTFANCKSLQRYFTLHYAKNEKGLGCVSGPKEQIHVHTRVSRMKREEYSHSCEWPRPAALWPLSLSLVWRRGQASRGRSLPCCCLRVYSSTPRRRSRPKTPPPRRLPAQTCAAAASCRTRSFISSRYGPSACTDVSALDAPSSLVCLVCLQNDAHFLSAIHEAYVQSLSKGLNNIKL